MTEDNRSSQGKVQGEGDYDAARRYRENVTEFVNKGEVEKLAQKAEPLSAKDAREMALAEDSARGRSKGDVPADIGIMYPQKKKADAAKG
jgi:hypothetical protein